MRRSKLEVYAELLNLLAHQGPLKLTHLMYKAKINCSVLKEDLDFLIKQGLVEERIIKKDRAVFAVTQRGIILLSYYREIKLGFSIDKEKQTKSYPPRQPVRSKFSS